MTEIIQHSSENDNIVLLVRNGGSVIVEEEKNKPVGIPLKDYLLQNKVAYWGYNNQYPFEVQEDIGKTPVLSQALYWISKAWISGGLVYGSLTIDKEGNDKLIRKDNPKLNALLRKNQINTEYLPLASNHFLKYWKTFTELIRNDDNSQIIGIKAHKSPWCRVGLQDEKTKRVEKCFINAQWNEYESASSKYTIELPIVQKGYDPVTMLKHRDKSSNYIYIVDGIGDTEKYYPKSPWHAIRESKWLKLVQEIPVFKAALMKNQSTLKYHVKIHPKYWESRFDTWNTLTNEDKQAKKNTIYTEIDNCLTGSSNSGKNLWSGYIIDPITQKEVEYIKVESLDDKIKDGKYIEDSQEGVATILYSLGFDGTLIGSTPAKSMGGGSGSDKREAWNIFITNCKPEQDKILEPIDFMAQYNGIVDENGEPYTFWFKNYYLQTLDKVAPEKRNTQAGTEK